MGFNLFIYFFFITLHRFDCMWLHTASLKNEIILSCSGSFSLEWCVKYLGTVHIESKSLLLSCDDTFSKISWINQCPTASEINFVSNCIWFVRLKLAVVIIFIYLNILIYLNIIEMLKLTQTICVCFFSLSFPLIFSLFISTESNWHT